VVAVHQPPGAERVRGEAARAELEAPIVPANAQLAHQLDVVAALVPVLAPQPAVVLFLLQRLLVEQPEAQRRSQLELELVAALHAQARERDTKTIQPIGTRARGQGQCAHLEGRMELDALVRGWRGGGINVGLGGLLKHGDQSHPRARDTL